MTPAETLFKDGQAAYGHKDYEKAADLFQQAIALDSTESGYWMYWGLSLEWLHRYVEAEDALTKAINLSPDIPHLYMNRGHIKYRAQKYHEALEDFNRAYMLDDTETWDFGLYNLFLYSGFCHEALGEYEHAIADYGLYGSRSGHPHAGDRYINSLKAKLAQLEQNKPNT